VSCRSIPTLLLFLCLINLSNQTSPKNLASHARSSRFPQLCGSDTVYDAEDGFKPSKQKKGKKKEVIQDMR